METAENKTILETENKITSPLKAIRAKCLDCVCYQNNEVKLCPSENCPLYPFRMGKNPFRKPRELSEEQKEKMIEALRKSREQKAEGK